MSIAQFRGRRSSALNCHGGQYEIKPWEVKTSIFHTFELGWHPHQILFSPKHPHHIFTANANGTLTWFDLEREPRLREHFANEARGAGQGFVFPTSPHSAMSAVAFLSAIALATVEAKAEFRTSVIRVHLCASVVNPPLCSLRYLCKSIPPSPSSILHLLSSCLAPPGFCLGNVKDPDPHGRPVFIGLSWMSRMSTSLAWVGGGGGHGRQELRIADCGLRNGGPRPSRSLSWASLADDSSD